MKKIVLSLALAAIISSFAFANATEINPGILVKEAFSKEFACIKDVKWDVINKEGIYQANFIFNNESLRAFFTQDGEFLGTSRKISTSQLPITIIRQLGKSYPDANTSTVFEYSMNDGLSYYITLITNKGAIIIKATGNGELTVYQRNKHNL